MAVAIPYGDMIIKGSQMGVWNTSPGAIFLFVVLVGLVNVALRRTHRGLALDKSELAVVYILLLIANTLPARGFAAYVMPIATGAQYYATPENDWSERLLPFLPDWATVKDERVVRQYYEGADQTQAGVPWDAWAAPLLYWLLFGLALYLVMVSVSVVLRRQWVERERLVYPTMQLPLHMIQEGRGHEGRPSVIPPFFKNRVMWLGFLLPFVIGNINALHNYFHYFPSISTSFGSIALFRGSIGVGFTLSFTLVGFSFLISRNIAAGLCFFYLVNVVEQGLFRFLGIEIDPGPVGAFGHYAHPIVMYQAMGGMIVLVLLGLWNARGHLRMVWRKAITRAGEVDDSDEIMSYRQAVFGGLLGLGVMTVWLWRAGLPLWIVPLLLGACFVLFLTITRVVAEGGVAVMFPPITGPDFVSAGVGTALLGPRGGAALATTYVWATDVLILLMRRLHQRPQVGRADRPPQKAPVLGHHGHGPDHPGRCHVDPPGGRLCARSHQPQPVLRCQLRLVPLPLHGHCGIRPAGTSPRRLDPGGGGSRHHGGPGTAALQIPLVALPPPRLPHQLGLRLHVVQRICRLDSQKLHPQIRGAQPLPQSRTLFPRPDRG